MDVSHKTLVELTAYMKRCLRLIQQNYTSDFEVLSEKCKSKTSPPKMHRTPYD